MQNGYDENKGYDKVRLERVRRTTASSQTTIGKQLTMHNKYTNDDVDLDDCVVHIMR